MRREKFEKLVELEKRNIRKKRGEKLSDDEGDDDYNDKKGEEIPNFKTNLNSTIRRFTEDQYDLNNFWKEYQPDTEKVGETPHRMEGVLMINGIKKNIKNIGNTGKVR